MLQAFAWRHVRMIRFVRARILEIDNEHCLVGIPLGRRTRNHLHSQYFGVLVVGADLAGGTMAFRIASMQQRKISFAFKDVHAEFHKRAEGETHFLCRDGAVIEAALNAAFESGKRINQPVQVEATVPDLLGPEIVASFRLTLSVKALQVSDPQGQA